ncbi:MAG: DUF3576 domain-containing protein [Hyphomicrobiales bacterium]|nr:MAG: DUF3576 domain-containing protein [Hyphomicrobiales bacterium]
MTLPRLTTALTTSFALAAAVFVAGCGIKGEAPEANPTDMPKGPGLFSGESGNILESFKSNRSKEESGGSIGVNIYLWRAALESVAFMPITQADSNGGVIVTDWYSQPEQPNERVKANILILGKTLRADALKVTLFKQQRVNGEWTGTDVSAATTTALEDTILTKARAIKKQTSGN